MAGKGTYGAYLSQAPQSSSEFAGARQFASMAAVTAQKRAEERAEQRQLRSEARQAVELAIEASNIDLGAIDTSLHTAVGSVLDSYAERVTDLSEALGAAYSFEKVTQLNKERASLGTFVTEVTSVGNNIKHISEGEWDPLMSAEAINGNTKFVLDLNGMMERMDPATGKIDGKRVSEIYREYVDFSKLTPPIDSESFLEEKALSLMDVSSTRSDIIGDRQRTKRIYQYDENEVRQLFNSEVLNTNEAKKTKLVLARRFEDGDEEATNYVSFDDDGDVYVSDRNLLDYFKSKLRKEEEISNDQMAPVREGTADRRARLQGEKEAISDAMKLRNIAESVSENGTTFVNGQHANIGAKSVELKKAQLGYDMLSGEHRIFLDYAYNSKDRVLNGVSKFSADNAGLQNFGNIVYKGDFSFIDKAYEFGFEPKFSGLTFDDRAVNIEEQLSSVSSNLSNVFSSAMSVDGAGFKDAVALMPEHLKEFGFYDEIVSGVLNELVSTRIVMTPGAKRERIHSSRFDTQEGVDALARAITITSAAVNAERRDNPDASVEELKAMARKNLLELSTPGSEFDYEFDNVKRYIKKNYKGSPAMIKKAREFMAWKDKVGQPYNDNEVIKFLDSGGNVPSAKNLSVEEMRNAVMSAASNPSAVEATISDLMGAGLSEEQAVLLLYENNVQ